MSVVTEIQKVINNGSTITFPPSVREIDIPEEALTLNCAGFLYLIQLLKDYEIFGKVFPKGTWYVGATFAPLGFHPKFKIYFQSGKDEHLKYIWLKNKPLLKFSILKVLPKHFSKLNIRMEEKRMYQEIQSTTTIPSWNGSSGVIAPNSVDVEKVEKLAVHIKNIVKIFMKDKSKFQNYRVKSGMYFEEVKTETLGDKKKFNFLQTKDKEKSKGERKSIKEIIKIHGDVKIEPTIVLKDFPLEQEDGTIIIVHLAIDGNSTYVVIQEEEIPTNNVLFIEKELYYDYFGITNDFLAGFLGNVYNRNEEINPTIKVYTDVSAAAKTLYKAFYALGWDKSWDYTQLDEIENANEIVEKFKLSATDTLDAFKKAKKRIRKKGKTELDKTRPDWRSEAMQPKKVKKIDEALVENGLSKNDTLVVEINSSSMNNTWPKLGDAIDKAKKGLKYVHSEITLKTGNKQVKRWKFVKTEGYKWKTIDNVLFMINHSQNEDHKENFWHDQPNDDGSIKEVAYVTNFKKYLTNFEFSKKMYFKDLPLYTKDLKDN